MVAAGLVGLDGGVGVRAYQVGEAALVGQPGVVVAGDA